MASSEGIWCYHTGESSLAISVQRVTHIDVKEAEATSYVHSFVPLSWCLSAFLSLSLPIVLTNSNMPTCPLAPGKMCFSSFCHHRLAPKRPPRLPFPLLSRVSSFRSSYQSQTCTYLWLLVCRGGQVLMIWPAVILIPLHRLFVIVGGWGACERQLCEIQKEVFYAVI